MIYETETFERVTCSYEDIDTPPAIRNPFHHFYLIPRSVTAEFPLVSTDPDNPGWHFARNIVIRGQRYRELKAGPKDVGQAVWDLPFRSSSWSHTDGLLQRMWYGRHGLSPTGEKL
jgi:hypothetical protein